MRSGTVAKVCLGCLGAAVVLTLTAAFGLWFLFFRDRPNLDATLTVDPAVELDAITAMVVTATNGHSRPVTLDSIDVDDAFLAGFQVVSVDPRPRETSHIPLIKQRSWEFGRAVPPGGVFTVTFTLRAVAEGRFSGDVDVCNPNQDFTSLLADVMVRKRQSVRD
jgi:hypothetical protein